MTFLVIIYPKKLSPPNSLENVLVSGIFIGYILTVGLHAVSLKKVPEGPGVTGQNIPPARVYPGIVWPRPVYTPGNILA